MEYEFFSAIFLDTLEFPKIIFHKQNRDRHYQRILPILDRNIDFARKYFTPANFTIIINKEYLMTNNCLVWIAAKIIRMELSGELFHIYKNNFQITFGMKIMKGEVFGKYYVTRMMTWRSCGWKIPDTKKYGLTLK